jgi:hypothetical protein
MLISSGMNRWTDDNIHGFCLQFLYDVLFSTPPV